MDSEQTVLMYETATSTDAPNGGSISSTEAVAITRIEGALIREGLGEFIGSSRHAITLPSQVHEAILRDALGCEPQPRASRSPIDGYRSDGSAGFQFKYRGAGSIRVEQELFADLDETTMIEAGSRPAGEQPIHTCIDYCSAEGPAIRRLALNGSAEAVLGMALELAGERLESAKKAVGVRQVHLALTVHSRDEHRFAQAIQPLLLPSIDELKCKWATPDRRTAIGLDGRTGNRVVQWSASRGQLKLDIYTDRRAFARFRVDWEVPA